MMGDGFGMGYGGGYMWIFWIFLIVAIAWLVISAIGNGRNSGQSGEKSAMDILNERYARGEIEKEEYEQKRRDLDQ